MQRAFEFQVPFAQMRHFAGDGALVAAAREAGHDLLDEDKPTSPDRMATGQPVKSARAAPRVAQAKNTLRVSRNRVTLEMCSLMRRSSPPGRFQFLNRENSTSPGFYGLTKLK